MVFEGQRGKGTSAIPIGGPQGRHKAIKRFKEARIYRGSSEQKKIVVKNL